MEPMLSMHRRLGLAVWAALVTLLALAPTVLIESRGQASGGRPQIDRIFGEWDRRDSPGCALALYQNGQIVYERGYGMADLEHDIAISPESVFYVGSLSKQFTAMAAALAIQQGRLSPSDSIRKFLPELPDYTGGITVTHLIHHTSGLRDYNTLLSIAGRRGDEAFDNPTVLRITAKQTKLNFQPGDEYLYSNTGYTLLATIIERAVGLPFAAYAEQQIFEPLGMTVSHYHVDESRLVKGRAMAYTALTGRGTSLGLDTPSNERAGAGGVFTNVRDLLKWDENFYKGRVGGRTVLEQVQTAGTLTSGTVLDYAWGLQLGRYRGLRIVEHSGSLGGYRAHLLRFPDQHFSVAALCNLASIAPGALARRVADVTLETRFTEPKPAGTNTAGGAGERSTPPQTTIARVQASELVGRYYSDEVDAWMTVAATEGRLTLVRDRDTEAAALEQVAADQFRFRGMTIRLVRNAGMEVEGLLVDAGRVRGIRFSRAGSVPETF